jgi:N-acetyl-gamma-glutamyl-phosphate reductase
MRKVAIVGGSGYIGAELAGLLVNHPGIAIADMASHTHAGSMVADIHPALGAFTDLRYCKSIPENSEAELVFVATEYGSSMEQVPGLLARGMKVIDMSGDYRFTDAELYKIWYGIQHKDPENLRGRVYGIPELFRARIPGARLVANPGCYPTGSILALAPLLKAGLIDPSDIIIDAKSGTSGAGIQPSAFTLHSRCAQNIEPYKIGTHRHMPEIASVLGEASGREVDVTFVPHLTPMVRGIELTIYTRLSRPAEPRDILAAFGECYAGSRFVRLVQSIPTVPAVAGSNFCDIGFAFSGKDRLVVVAAIDNLVKGGAGQAVQNANLMFGLDEAAGLWFPGMGV